MGFAQFYPWQQSQKNHLLSLVDRNTLPHALLFCGHKGLGKLSCGLQFFNWLLCQNPQSDQPCLQCKSCQLYPHHPDMLVCKPEDDSRIIKINMIRQITEFLTSRPQQSQYKLVIVDPAESMTINAANALLKNLEEPVTHAVIILISAQRTQLIPTIRSRCQTIHFSPPDKQQARVWLQQHNIMADKIDLLLNLANGSPLQAMILHDNNALQLRHILLRDLAALLRQHKSPLEVADAWQEYELLTILEWWNGWCMDLLKISVSNQDESVHNQDAVKLFIAIATAKAIAS